VRGSAALVTDERVAPEGAQWDSPVAIVFELPSGVVTYDLGTATSVSAFFVQADANDTYKIFGSLDGSLNSYKPIVEVEMVAGDGLRGRTVKVNPTTVRYLRIGEGVGDNFYSLSEFAAYCTAPDPFPPKMGISNAPPAKAGDRPWWNNETSARLEMALAFAGMALILWGIALRRKGIATYMRRWRNILFVCLGLLGTGFYWNFGSFHFGNYIHIWEFFHYYMGSKYFPELSYDRLYDCATVADSEDPRIKHRAELRKIMDLRTNMMVKTTDILAKPELCKSHFSPERWESFKRDIAYFRYKHGDRRWEDVFGDHGYNATPVWTVLGSWASSLGAASDTQLYWLSVFDWAAAIGMLAMIGWGFGWRTFCVAAAVFGTNFPSRFYWTGGAFLRWDWLFYLVGGICLLKREKWVLGGFFLSYSTLLRVFPAFTLVGPGMVLVQEYIRTRDWKKLRRDPAVLVRGVTRLDRRYLSLFGGAALAVAVLVPVSLVRTGGVDSYRSFVRNTVKHAETPLTNYMGLRTVVAYKMSEAGRVLMNNRMDDPWGPWKIAKLKTFHHRMPIFLVLAAGFAALLWFAVRGADPWVACALSASMIAVGAELTSYYYSFIVAVTLLYHKRHKVGAIMLGVTAITSFIDWAPTRFLPDTRPFIFFKMPTWLDEQYMWMGLVTLLGFVWIMYDFCFPPGQAAGATRKAYAAVLRFLGLDEPAPAPAAAAAGAAVAAGATATAAAAVVARAPEAAKVATTVAAKPEADDDDDDESDEPLVDDEDFERALDAADGVAGASAPARSSGPRRSSGGSKGRGKKKR